MNYKKITLLSFLTILLFSLNTAHSQWKYETSRKLNKDIIINYSVTYDDELTDEQKNFPFI